MKLIKGVIVIPFVLFIFVRCAPKPTYSEMEKAIKIQLQGYVPVSWVGNLMGGKNTKIKSIEIIEWGSFNSEQEYWPVQIRVAGSAELNDIFNRGKIRNFDKVGEFKFYQDEYGQWQTVLSGGMFQ